MPPKQFCDEVSERFRRLTTAMESSNDFFIRTTDPEHERRVQDFVQHLYDDGHLYEGTYAGLYCSSCEVFYAEGDLDPARQPVPDPQPPRRLGGGEELVLPALEVGAEAAGAVRRQPRLRAPPRPLQRGPLDDRRRARGRLLHPGQRQLGDPGAVGAEPDHLRVGGRAAQLPHRTGVRPRPRRHVRVLADLAAPDGQGHPAAARHHLAGDAAGGRLRAAPRPVRARLLHHRAARR